MCLFPIDVLKYEVDDPLTGEVKNRIHFCKDPEYVKSICKWKNPEVIALPCGKCIECVQEKSKEWSWRLCNEAKTAGISCFLTLTYEKTHGSLVKQDLTLFLKRLRRHLEPQKIRYFACGEYGSKGNRPHFHVIIFGWRPDDLVYFFTDKKGNDVYLSDFIAKLWKLGFISVMDVGPGTTKYVGKYMQKFNSIPSEYVQPYITMSLKPGIGAQYFFDHQDSALATDKVYLNGKYIKLPRYYLKLAERAGKDLTDIKANRVKKADLCRLDDAQLQLKRERLYETFDKLIIE